MTERSVKSSKKDTSVRKGAEGIYKNLENQFEKVFHQAVKATQGKVSIKTHHRYRDSMKQVMSFCAEKFRLQKLSKISDKHVMAYIEYRRTNGISEKTIKSDIAALRFFHRHMEGTVNKLMDNEKTGLLSTPDGRRDRAWHESEYNKFLKIAEKLDRKDALLAMRLSRHAGLRIHEVTRLDRAQAESAIEKGILHVKGKGGKERDIPLNSKAVESLKEACKMAPGKNSKLLVNPGEKTHVVIQSIQNFIRRHRGKVFEKDGRERITFHGLRHLYAREQYAERERKWVYKGKRYKFDIRAMKEVSELLGHGRREVTRIYLGR